MRTYRPYAIWLYSYYILSTYDLREVTVEKLPVIEFMSTGEEIASTKSARPLRY